MTKNEVLSVINYSINNNVTEKQAQKVLFRTINPKSLSY